jgi:SAM-dependent methyltransferase/uncharacterized protein YbaR (Trm112 family)
MNEPLFDRSKIYEKLEIAPKPAGYNGRIPWVVQQQIAATNGIHFKDSVGFLQEYPIPPLPVPAVQEQRLFLDIGCGWGRWLVAAGKKNYLPVGIDIRLEFCETALAVVRDNGFNGHAVVADLKNLPFRNDVFDVIWSFSVIQHTHYDRLNGCLAGIANALKTGAGYCFLEFPNKNGLHNHFGPAKTFAAAAGDYNSWDVRYYTPKEYKDIFLKYFDNFRYTNHSALGIGVLPGDAKYARGFKNKSGIVLSRSLSRLFEIIGPLKAFSDSIYIQCYKNNGDKDTENSAARFMEASRRNPGNNLNIVHILSCPMTKDSLTLSGDGNELISRKAGLAYPIKNDIPILIASEARSL